MNKSNAIMLQSTAPDSTRALGAALGRAALSDSDSASLVIALNGELGAGKTTFVGGFLTAFGWVGPARSPTYTLIEPYELDERTVYHLDLYRIGEPRDLEMLALRDLLHPGAILLVEWAERGGANLPAPDLSILLSYSSTMEPAARSLQFESHTTRGKELAVSVQRSADKERVSL